MATNALDLSDRAKPGGSCTRDANGRKQTRRAALTGLHGSRIPFTFAALKFAAPKLAADQYEFDVVLRVMGELRGRVKNDGTLEVELWTRRRNSLERRAGESPAMVPGGSGRKVLSLKPGEAVEVEIPVAGGTMGSRLREQAQPSSGVSGGLRGAGSGTPPTEPFVLRGNSYVVNFKPFFDGHRVTLIVQARRQA